MATVPIYSSRYTNVVIIFITKSIKNLVTELQNQAKEYDSARTMKIKHDRKNHQSCCEMMERNKQKQVPTFNNKTHNEGKLFDPQLKSVPYMYLSKHKHEHLIIPDRAFAKGTAAKRFFIKMKDTSVYSFKLKEDETTSSHLRKEEKEKTIIGRKLQELERIIDHEDGKIKAKNNRWFLMNRKTFRPPSNPSDLFSRIDPMLEPQEFESVEFKRLSLTKSFSKQNKWRPSTQYSNKFMSATSGSSMYARTDILKKRTFR